MKVIYILTTFLLNANLKNNFLLLQLSYPLHETNICLTHPKSATQTIKGNFH